MAKRIITKSKKESKTNQYILTAIVVVILIGSTLGIMAGSDSESVTYNGFRFRRHIEGQGFLTRIQGKEMHFSSLPQDSKQIEMPNNSCDLIRNNPELNIIFEPNAESITFIDYIRNDFRINFEDKHLNFFITEESEDYHLYTVKTCDNATVNRPFIFFNESSKFKISFEDNCLTLNGRNQDFMLLRDRIMYCYYEVIE